MNKKPKVTGEISEINVLARLVTLGFVCSKPFGDNAPYDLIVDTGHKLVKLQVKTTWHRDDAITIKFSRVRINTKKNYTKFYALSEVDYFAAYDKESDRVFIIKNSGLKSISLRNTSTNYGICHMANDYVLTIDSFN